jgi:D-alanyl-lipoteichoic acid acyltransferase DltB (MBOAT superfamily)
MFSWSIFWIACICLGIVGACAKSQSANTIFQVLLLMLSFTLIVFGLKVSLVPVAILVCFALFAIVVVRLGLPAPWAFVPIVLIWAVAKSIGFVLVPSLPLVAFVGISYFVVKLFTFLRDYQSGLVKNPRVVTILNYLFFAPTFLAGPMHYYREFDKSVRTPKLPSAEASIPLVFRILWGATKVFVLAPFLLPRGLPVPPDVAVTGIELVLRSFVFSFQLYFEFSGYSDMALGSAKLMGIDTPENFNKPLLSRNIVEFWQRWHITLMRVITSYVYVPLTRYLSSKKSIDARLTMVLGITGAFLVSGFWHGATANFILWGLYNAVGIIVYEICRPSLINMKKRKLFAGKAMSGAMRIVSVCLTFIFISLGWIIFTLDPNAVKGSFGI